MFHSLPSLRHGPPRVLPAYPGLTTSSAVLTILCATVSLATPHPPLHHTISPPYLLAADAPTRPLTPLGFPARNILKTAARFPSKKRAGIIEDIKTEFRANKDITDEKEISRLRCLAQESLEQLRSYVSLATDGIDSIYLKGPCQQSPDQ